MTRPLALATALLVLAACDAGGPEAPSAAPILGTWTVASSLTESLGTVSRSQAMIDLARAPEGALTVTGAEAGAIRYVRTFQGTADESAAELSSADPAASPAPASRLTLGIDWAPGRTAVYLSSEAAGRSPRYFQNETPGAGLSVTGARYTLDLVLTSTADPTASVRVAGTLTLGHRDLAAGVPTALSEMETVYGPSDAIRYTFAGDGGFLQEQVLGDETVERPGTWALTADRLVLTFPDDGLSYASTVRFEGASLVLSADVPVACDAACLTNTERGYGIVAGTLDAFLQRQTTRLSPVDAAARRR